MRYILNVDPRLKLSDKIIEQEWDLPVYIVFSGRFDEENAKKFRLELEAAELAAKKAKQEIIPIVIDSYGGSAYSLLSMVDAINNCSLPVSTIVESKAMSCGAILFSCGKEGYRFVAPNATILIHDVSAGMHGKEPDIRASADESKRINKLVYKLMADNCGHEAGYFYDIITEKRGADWYITAEEAVEHNLANKIHMPSMTVDVDMKIKYK
jgi:ATP-dependent Clp protease, protease subunit